MLRRATSYLRMDHSRLAISNDRISLEIAPGVGGSVTQMRVDGVDILRPAPPGQFEVVDAASFPMVPIVNRIPCGRFSFAGRHIQLPGNFMDLPDFIHGHGWHAAWDVTRVGSDVADLAFRHDADEWPWTYGARQQFRLLENGIHCRLRVTNHDTSPMPVCLGFHPFFPITPATRLLASYEGHWVNNEWGHPLRRVPDSHRKGFIKGSNIFDEIMIDRTHYGFSGTAELRENGRPTTRITACEFCNNLHVFSPSHGNFVALEPATGRGDPFGRRPAEYRVLLPQKSFEIWMRIVALASDRDDC